METIKDLVIVGAAILALGLVVLSLGALPFLVILTAALRSAGL